MLTVCLLLLCASRPIQVLRIIATVLFGVFDIATLTLVQVSYDCQALGSGSEVRGKLYAFDGKGGYCFGLWPSYMPLCVHGRFVLTCFHALDGLMGH